MMHGPTNIKFFTKDSVCSRDTATPVESVACNENTTLICCYSANVKRINERRLNVKGDKHTEWFLVNFFLFRIDQP